MYVAVFIHVLYNKQSTLSTGNYLLPNVSLRIISYSSLNRFHASPSAGYFAISLSVGPSIVGTGGVQFHGRDVIGPSHRSNDEGPIRAFPIIIVKFFVLFVIVITLPI